MTYYTQHGLTYTITNNEELNICEFLPPNTYNVEFNPLTGFYLTKIDSFEIGFKVYGNLTSIADRILNTYIDRRSNTGVLLSGEKGSGKTLLSKLLSVKSREEKEIPTLIINQSFCGDAFSKFLQSIDQPALLFFDEFEKVYTNSKDDEDNEIGSQTSLLTLLDGTFQSNKLFVFTCNDKYGINSHMNNRPGRIYYHLEFDGLDNSIIREYAQEKLINQENVESVCNLASLYSKFNFDMLRAIIEEMNRYNETALEAIKFLNVKFQDDYVNYNIVLNIDGIDIDPKRLQKRDYRGNPLIEDSHVIVYYDKPYVDDYSDGYYATEKNSSKKSTENKTKKYTFKKSDLERIDADAEEVIFNNGKATLIYKKVYNREVDYALAYSGI